MFKRIIYFSFIVLIASCTKVDISSPDDFGVTTAKSTYAVSDTVEFVFSGNPGYITFFSGEPHKKYALSKIQYTNPDSNIVVFTTNTTAATATNQSSAVNNLSVLVSTDFNGVYDSANIKKATWTNISSRASWATTTTSVSSGLVHVEDITKGTTPFYIAFKYVSDTAKTTSLPRKWQVASFSYKNYFPDTALALAGGASGTSNPFMTGGFKQVNILNASSNWVYANANITFNAALAGNLPDEDWSVSRVLEPNLYPADLGTQIKNQSVALASYKYRFSKAGTYKVSFVAKNADSNTSYEVVKEITLTIQ